MKPVAEGPHSDAQDAEPHVGDVKLVAQATWSQRRSWHGEKVKMLVRTALVKDGTSVEIKVVPNGNDALIDTVSGKSVTGGKLEQEYEIKWQGKPFAAFREFVLQTKVGDKLNADPSETLYVDLDSPIFSG